MLQVGAESDKEDIFHGAGCPLGFRSLRLHLTAEERLTKKPKQNVVHCNSTMLIARHTCVCQRAPACSAKGTLSPKRKLVEAVLLMQALPRNPMRRNTHLFAQLCGRKR